MELKTKKMIFQKNEITFVELKGQFVIPAKLLGFALGSAKKGQTFVNKMFEKEGYTPDVDYVLSTDDALKMLKQEVPLWGIPPSANRAVLLTFQGVKKVLLRSKSEMAKEFRAFFLASIGEDSPKVQQEQTSQSDSGAPAWAKELLGIALSEICSSHERTISQILKAAKEEREFFTGLKTEKLEAINPIRTVASKSNKGPKTTKPTRAKSRWLRPPPDISKPFVPLPPVLKPFFLEESFRFTFDNSDRCILPGWRNFVTVNGMLRALGLRKGQINQDISAFRKEKGVDLPGKMFDDEYVACKTDEEREIVLKRYRTNYQGKLATFRQELDSLATLSEGEQAKHWLPHYRDTTSAVEILEKTRGRHRLKYDKAVMNRNRKNDEALATYNAACIAAGSFTPVQPSNGTPTQSQTWVPPIWSPPTSL